MTESSINSIEFVPAAVENTPHPSRPWRKIGAAAALLAAVGFGVNRYEYSQRQHTEMEETAIEIPHVPIPQQFDVISWNIHKGETTPETGSKPNDADVIDTLQEHAFVMAGLQEVPADMAPDIIAATHTIGIFTPSFTSQVLPLRRNTYGNLLLLNPLYTSPEALTIFHQQLDMHDTKHWYWPFSPLKQRTMLMATFNDVSGETFSFIDTHLEARSLHSNVLQAEQVKRTLDHKTSILNNVALTADINASVGSSHTSHVLTGSELAVTRTSTPSFNDHETIDGVFVSKFTMHTVRSITLETGSISDHKPVVSRIEQAPDPATYS